MRRRPISIELTNDVPYVHVNGNVSDTFNPYVAIGGYFTPRRTFYAVALKPLRIVTKAFVTS